jgi:hypothetical protein
VSLKCTWKALRGNAMTLLPNMSTNQMSLAGLDLLQALSLSGDQEAVRLVMAGIMNGVYGLKTRDSDGISPSMAAASDSQIGVLVVHGTDNPQQETPQVTGWVNNPAFIGNSDAVENPSNPWINVAGLAAYNVGEQANIWDCEYVFVFGHSAGHGISSTALYYAISKGEVRSQNVYNISFGGNGFASKEKIAAFSNARVNAFRWMNAEDPVPCFPWCTTRQLPTIAGYTPPTMRAIANVQHIGEARNLPISGGYTRDVLPSQADINPAVATASWLWLWDQGVTNFHSTSIYRQRIAALPSDLGMVGAHSTDTAPNVPTITQVPVSVPVTLTNTQASEEIRSLVSDAQSAVANAAAVVPVVSPGENFVARKTNGVWSVWRGDTNIVACQSKGLARTVARRLNRIERDTEALNTPDLASAFAFFTS